MKYKSKLIINSKFKKQNKKAIYKIGRSLIFGQQKTRIQNIYKQIDPISCINKNQFMNSSSTDDQSIPVQYSPILPTQQTYPTALYILCPILITYYGIYIMLRNHYIYNPRIQIILRRSFIKSKIIKQIILNILTSISIFTYIISSIILSINDNCLRLIMHNDLYWIGLGMSIIVYRNIKEKQFLEIKVVIKNGIFLLLSYVVIVYQYFSNYSLLMMALILIALYLINLIFKINQIKFVSLIQILFNSKPLQIGNVSYNHINKLQSPQYLSTNFPVLKQQIQQRLITYQPLLKKLKLKTKISVTKKLLMLSLAVRISQQKMITKMKKDVGSYYGGLNGTTNQKVKRLELQVKNSLQQQSKQQLYNRQQSLLNRQQPFLNRQSLKKQQSLNKQDTNQINQQDVILNILQVDDQLQVLFTIFPIRLFQSSVLISIVFNIFINLLFGICLDYTITITSTLQYGHYFNNLYALLLLPVLPNVSKIQYFNSMALFSLWKYFLIGFFISIGVAVNGGIQTSNIISIQVILVIVMLIFVNGYLLVQSKSEYKLFIVFFLLFSVNLAITYGQVASST